MKRVFILFALVIAIMSTLGFVVSSEKQQGEDETDQLLIKAGAEKSGFVETISL